MAFSVDGQASGNSPMLTPATGWKTRLSGLSDACFWNIVVADAHVVPDGPVEEEKMHARGYLLAVLAMAAWPAWAEPNGSMLAQGCAGCHGQSGAGQGAVPDLRGYDRDAMVHSLQEFQADERPATIMNRIARGYTEAELAALADYFASLD